MKRLARRSLERKSAGRPAASGPCFADGRSMNPNRLALFAHFDAQDQVKRYVVEYLAQLRTVCERVVFVSTSRLAASELDKVRPFAGKALLRDNAGFDFGMWQHALERTDLAGVDEVV